MFLVIKMLEVRDILRLEKVGTASWFLVWRFFPQTPRSIMLRKFLYDKYKDVLHLRHKTSLVNTNIFKFLFD